MISHAIGARRESRPPGRRCLSVFLLLLLLLCGGVPVLRAEPALVLQAGSTNALTLDQFLQLVLERNESLQLRVLEFEISRKKLGAEKGTFEPELVGSYDRVENKRQNTAEQRRSTGTIFFEEKNDIYNAGLESLIPTGARIRLGYTLRDLRNNLQDPPFGGIVTNSAQGEYQTFAGLSLSQPLLKNAWLPATLANIRLAAIASEVAYQDYRRQMMLVISSAEAAYWNLFMMQEQVRFFRDSVALSTSLLQDNRARFQVGKGSDLEVLETEAGLALRRTKLAEAEQKYFETTAQLFGFLSQTAGASNIVILAVNRPGISAQAPGLLESSLTAFDLNPDYLAQLKRLKQEEVRVSYARNQRLPELDLKASFGLNGLGSTPGDSWEQAQTQDFPAMAIGVEMRLPLAGGIKGRNEVAAAKLRKQQALVALKDVETQMLNAIENAIRKVGSARQATQNYETVVNFSQNLLDTELARLAVGKVESRKVLDADAGLFEARNSVVEAQVQFERARLELELAQGSLLRARNLDLQQKALEDKLNAIFDRAGITRQQYRELLKDINLEYKRLPLTPEDGTIERARQVLREQGTEPAPRQTRPASEEETDPAVQLLRRTMEELNQRPAPKKGAPSPP